MKKVKVEFETITPIFTGDAWGKNSEIKASSVMGSLRFWFEVYCHFAGIDVKEKEELKEKDYQKILKSLKKDIDDDKNIEDIDKYIFDKLPLTLSSKIFGCTGWKSRIEIEQIVFKKRTIKANDFDYNYLHSQDNNTKWWTKKVLYDNQNQIDVFENIVLELKIDNNVLNDVKKFFKFYQDEPILIGGKKAFGFGFVKLKSNLDLSDIDIEIKKDDIVIWDSIKIRKNNITGYNIKYFLRKKENKKYRTINFGKMGQASNFFFSMPKNGTIYIISFNNKTILDKYKRWIKKSEQFQNKQINKKYNKKLNNASIDDLKNKWGSR